MPEANASVKLRQTIPVFLVGDIRATMQWYQSKLGFDVDPFPPSPPYAFCILRKDDIEIFLQQLDGYQKPEVYGKREGGVWDIYIRMQGVRAQFDRLSKLDDVQIISPLRRQPYGQTEFVVHDPNGYTIVFAEVV